MPFDLFPPPLPPLRERLQKFFLSPQAWTQFSLTLPTDEVVLVGQQDVELQPPPGVKRGSEEDRMRLIILGEKRKQDARKAVIPVPPNNGLYFLNGKSGEQMILYAPKYPMNLTIVRLPMWLFRWIPWSLRHLREMF